MVQPKRTSNISPSKLDYRLTMAPLKYKGCAHFRERITAASLSGKSLKIEYIRSEEYERPGLQDFEASYLRLMDKITDGCNIEINETGTTLRYKPGLLIGGRITHDCGLSRSIGWFIEGIIPMAVFCKESLHLTLTGITNDSIDLSVDVLKTVTLPILRNFGIEGSSLTIKKRGAAPKGGGVVEIIFPIVRCLRPINITNSGQVRRIRGSVFCSKISPTVISRVIDSSKSVLNHVITDVFINSDHYKGSDGGLSAGYSLLLVAESTTGALLSVERTAGQQGELPETVGQDGALMLLDEMCRGGVIDRSHQSLILQLMTLGPEDVCKVRFGNLTDNAIETLRILRDAFGVIFKIKADHGTKNSAAVAQRLNEMAESGQDNNIGTEVMDGLEGAGDSDEAAASGLIAPTSRKYCDESGTTVLSCLGIGFTNMSRKIL